jgi:hypothetical protein
VTAKQPTRQQERLGRLVELVANLPEVETSGAQHKSFRIRRKNFAYYLNDHHGDGIVSLCCKASFDEQANLVELDPEAYYVPSYVGAKGWVAIRLDGSRVNWPQVNELLVKAYRAQAPKKLAEQVA